MGARDCYGLESGGGECRVVDFVADFAGEAEECSVGGGEGVF